RRATAPSRIARLVRVALLASGVAGVAPSVAVPLAAQDTSAVRSTARGILVDFQNTDIRVVITALAEAAGLNVTYGDLPARPVTLRLRQPVAPADVLPLL